MIYSKRLDPLIHITGWLLFYSLFLFFFQQGPGKRDLLDHIFSPSFVLFALIYPLVFYVNYYLLVPSLYFKDHTWWYLLTVLGMLIIICIVQPFDRLISEHMQVTQVHTQPPPPPMHHNMFEAGQAPPGGPGDNNPGGRIIDITSVIAFIMTWAISSAVCFLKQWKQAVEKAAAAESEKANAELSFLKAQVNPHFLFNTLNNIYSLTVSKNDAAPDAVMRLSNIMRYVTDDAGTDYVSLQAEVDCMSDFIDLQRLRLNDKVQVEFKTSGPLDHTRIPPLLLMAFVENAFKHGISSHEETTIRIKIAALKGHIHFYCSNRIFNTQQDAERSGIGMKNALRRLEYLYKERYEMNISDANNMFVVDLLLKD